MADDRPQELIDLMQHLSEAIAEGERLAHDVMRDAVFRYSDDVRLHRIVDLTVKVMAVDLRATTGTEFPDEIAHLIKLSAAVAVVLKEREG